VLPRLDGLPEAFARSIHTAHVAPALRTLLSTAPRPVVLTAQVSRGHAAPLALRQLVKLALEGGRLTLGGLALADGHAAPHLALAASGRTFDARGDAIDADAQPLLRRALAALFDPHELAAMADGFAADASKLAAMQRVVRAMLAASDVGGAVHAMLTGITSGDCLGFHRAALFVRDGKHGGYVGSQAIGPRDGSEAHRIWEEIEVERKSLDAVIGDYDAAGPGSPLQLFVQRLVLRPGPAPDDEVAGVERAGRGALTFRRARPVNEGLAAMAPATDFALAAVRPHGETLGLIFVDDAFGQQAIGPDRVRDLEFFVDQAALVWENFALLARVAALAREDALTGLLNRRELEARFAEAASRARRTGAAFGVLLVDVDHFKAVNDTLGHERGDEVLRTIAGLLQKSVRGHDAVARFGGDEFVVLLEGPAGELASAARRIGQRVRELSFSVSIGVGAWPDDCADPAKLFAVADANLYRAKRAGRGRACLAGGEPFGFDDA
jgi:diguanylate cyclase (GGDEF)-like protein